MECKVLQIHIHTLGVLLHLGRHRIQHLHQYHLTPLVIHATRVDLHTFSTNTVTSATRASLVHLGLRKASFVVWSVLNVDTCASTRTSSSATNTLRKVSYS